LPVLYFSVSHVAFALAWLAVAIDPRGVAGFFYHARMLAIVHLITLGWITTSILGSLYLVGPIALRVRFPATRLDYTAFGLVTVGTIGMVAHFWLEEYDGMAWSGATVGSGILLVGWRVVRRVMTSTLPKAVSAHLVLAFLNVFGAATFGVLLGFDKVYHFLPGYVLTNVFAHAHLAAIGWASMMVVGVAYRLLPMVLPAQMPKGPRLWFTAVLLEVGLWGLTVTLLLRARFTWIFALVIVAGFAVFLFHVIWMARRPRPRPPGIRTPDPAVLHAAAAFASLVVASTVGTWLTLAEPSEWFLRIGMTYGVFGLVGFLAQLVVGMEGRLLPLFAWYWAYANTNFKGPVPSPHEMSSHGTRELVFVLWLFAIPSLAGGLAFHAIPFVRAAALSLLVATVLDTANMLRIIRHAFVVPNPSSAGSDRAAELSEAPSVPHRVV
jgi:hypothetical protein